MRRIAAALIAVVTVSACAPLDDLIGRNDHKPYHPSTCVKPGVWPTSAKPTKYRPGCLA